MILARIETPAGVVHATPAGDGLWQPVTDPYAAFAAGSAPEPVGSPVAGTPLAASTPTVVVGIAQPAEPGGEPGAWLKSPRTVTASGVDVVARRDAGRVVIEGEVAVVIGKPTAGVTAENAHEFVLGVTAVNDVSSPDRPDVRNFEVKGGEGYTPLGPWIDTDASLEDASLVVAIDGVERVATGAADLAASVAQCVAYVAHWVELGPGDVIMTGAPLSGFTIEPEATVEITVAGVPLVNRFV
ncbi:fumarylacetoacetate hydrolase family protein [Microbacterium indicum]|uniref:fumarylacetoacetate hydrolase family protein n=1 Tax=Microbacterium indicum TaxID=358100 RepID=UPI00040C6D91|nr:fumarylacetoacetate hydrolase family protein [Microbacterium indicum]